jgi:hypothetical protein
MRSKWEGGDVGKSWGQKGRGVLPPRTRRWPRRLPPLMARHGFISTLDCCTPYDPHARMGEVHPIAPIAMLGSSSRAPKDQQTTGFLQPRRPYVFDGPRYPRTSPTPGNSKLLRPPAFVCE